MCVLAKQRTKRIEASVRQAGSLCSNSASTRSSPRASPTAEKEPRLTSKRAVKMSEVLAVLDNQAPIMHSPPKIRARKAKVTVPPADKAAAKACAAAKGGETPGVARIKLLAISFNQCSNPGARALLKLSRRCGMQLQEVEAWFERRKMLEEW